MRNNVLNEYYSDSNNPRLRYPKVTLGMRRWGGISFLHPSQLARSYTDDFSFLDLGEKANFSVQLNRF